MSRNRDIPLILSIIFASTPALVLADQPKFKVDSFIPQKFTDLEIRLGRYGELYHVC